MNHWTQNQGLRSLDEFVQNEILCQRKYNIPSTDRPICHSMNMELIRLKSFQNFPSSKDVSTLRLARQGFYYSMEYDVTICFACGCRKRDWRSGDDIEVVHRNMSPDCPLLSSQPTSNIKIGNNKRNGHDTNALEQQRINFDRPKYPSYSVLAVRLSSFADWPSSLSQTPRDLAVAGFLYAGYGDYTRCFFCGGGLRNWETGDDPWTEHARWFPKCAFVRQNKGDEFVALVQIQHQELEAMGAPNENQAGDQASRPLTSTSERSSLPNVCNLPAFQSVLEMGYPSHVIQEAFDVLKNTKEYINIKAEEVMETILSRDDKPPPSAAKTSDSVNNIIKKSYEDIINVNKQQTNSSGSITKESSEADTRSLIEENRQLKDLRMCKICMENDASIAMLPCGHLCCCTDCAPAMRKCPICQQFVKGTVRTWLA
uniref:RING-type domain-containing protein n=1 Tax=Magallana gigas TaxID=29159 RepID=A0A8W8JHI4_MAGGI